MAVELQVVRHSKDPCADSKYLPLKGIQNKMEQGIDIKHSDGLYTGHLTMSWGYWPWCKYRSLIAQVMGLMNTLTHSLSFISFLSFIQMVLFLLSCLVMFHCATITTQKALSISPTIF